MNREDAERELAEAFKELTDADGVDIEIVTPQFERLDGREPSPAPTTEGGFDLLKQLPEDRLKELGMIRWSAESGIWLFPGEWYDHIPKGYEITTINGETRPFFPGRESRDIRGGCLAFGIEVDDD